MEITQKTELERLTRQYYKIALSHVDANTTLTEKQRQSLSTLTINEEAELPGYEESKLKFGKFENREFVVMMTDIRDSTSIINGINGHVNMFLIFYVYAGIVAKIVDKYKGTSTEFLGDGVVNLFGVKELGLDIALQNSMGASREIMEARETILNPFFLQNDLPAINMGIGIDHGITIVTHFGYKTDTDLKAFGPCAYHASKLSKLVNTIVVSENSKRIWPTGPSGTLRFGNLQNIQNNLGYPIIN
ncbi:adenylate/guanylate cyclase domain-containing protein [Flavobacterium sp. 25HG05S-40]|uniref:adenylate/guanylate cyclase domain-containing protein n=1 Tax=Flavobacterium sp. 25HG05S-40 TaxID=3458682 RepID=UPI00404472E2